MSTKKRFDLDGRMPHELDAEWGRVVSCTGRPAGGVAGGRAVHSPSPTLGRPRDRSVELAGRARPMIHHRAASATDRMDHRFCERCGNPADPLATLTRAGLTTCRACGIHACQHCWARSVGSCPACGASVAATPLLRSLPAEQARAANATGGAARSPAAPTPGETSSRVSRAALAAAGGALVLAATVFVFMLVSPLRPTGGVAGATATPGASGPYRVGFASPVASQGAVESGPSATDRTGTSSGATADQESGGGTPPRQATPDPQGSPPAPTPPPEPTAVPTPPPTSVPTTTPEPTAPPPPAASGCVATAPNLVGQHRNEAQRLWIAAGFTGPVTALAGHGNYVIASQDRTPGAVLPCDAGVTIGP